MNRRHEWAGAHGFARNSGLETMGWAPVAAEMLAAERLLPGSLSGNRTDELTPSEWLMIRSRAEGVWLSTAYGEGVSPFLRSLHASTMPPGFFEHIRRETMGVITRSIMRGDAAGKLEVALSLVDLVGDMRRGEAPPVSLGRLLAGAVNQVRPKYAYCAYENAAVAALILGSSGVQVLYEAPNETACSFWSALAVGCGADVLVTALEPKERFEARFDRDYEPRDVSIVAPPFGTDGPYAWAVMLAREMAHHRALCLLPNNFLFRNSVADQGFKERVVREYGLSAVVGLPPGSLSHVSNTLGALVVMDSPAPGGVLMLDARQLTAHRGLIPSETIDLVLRVIRERSHDNLARVVLAPELQENSFNLLPDRYAMSSDAAYVLARIGEAETATLDDLVEIIRPQASPPPHKEELDASNLLEVSELVVSDLSEVGLARLPSKRLQLPYSDVLRVRRAELQEGDVLLVTKGGVGRVGFVRRIPKGQTWIANQSFAILRLRGSSALADGLVLFRYLSSKIGQELLQKLRVGSALPTLQMADLKRLPVMIPSREEQADLALNVSRLFQLEDEIGRIRERQAALAAQLWPDGDH